MNTLKGGSWELLFRQHSFIFVQTAVHPVYCSVRPRLMDQYQSVCFFYLWWVFSHSLVLILNPLSPLDALKHYFTSPKTFPTTRGFMLKIPLKLIYQCMAIFLNFSPTSIHLHPLQVENCDSNSRLVVEEDDNGKFRLDRVKALKYCNTNNKHQIYIF